MKRNEAKRILGDQPKWALTHMARALQIHSYSNSREDWERLRALRALGYKVTAEIPDDV